MTGARISDEQALYAAVRGALDRVAGALTSAECTSFAIRSVLDVVNRAVSDFSEEWNDGAHGFLSPLPTELRTACFQWLTFRDRMAISHVSRGWRRTMLQTPVLWDSVPATALSYDKTVALFREIAARSGSVALDVRCPFRQPTEEGPIDTLQRLIGDNMPRIRRLRYTVSRAPTNSLLFLRSDARSLESLEILMLIMAPLELPAQWIAGHAPRLMYLSITLFTLPVAHSPLHNITHFQGQPDSGSDLRALFTILPRLRTLVLEEIPESVLLPHTPPPVSLERAYLSTYPETDVSELMHAWAGSTARTKRTITFETNTAHPALGAAAHFMAAAHSTPWTLFLPHSRSPLCVRLQRTGESELDMDLLSLSHQGCEAVWQLRGSPHLGMLQVMHLGAEAWVFVQQAGVSFPALRELTITDNGSFAASAIRFGLDPTIALSPVHFPQLQSLMVTFSQNSLPGTISTLSQLPAFVSRCLVFDADKLQGIVISQAPQPLDNEMIRLLYCAPTVYWHDGVEYQGFFRAEDESQSQLSSAEEVLPSLYALTD